MRFMSILFVLILMFSLLAVAKTKYQIVENARYDRLGVEISSVEDNGYKVKVLISEEDTYELAESYFLKTAMKVCGPIDNSAGMYEFDIRSYSIDKRIEAASHGTDSYRRLISATGIVYCIN